MAQKRIRLVRYELLKDRVTFLYDDGTNGEIVWNKELPPTELEIKGLVGLTLKQAKLKLGIKKG